MRWYMLGVAMIWTLACAQADGPALRVQDLLDRGELANGELELQATLELHPDDDQLRFSLGVVQLVRAFERLGQSLYLYGIRSEVAASPILRLPVPENPDPAPISYVSFCRLFEDLYRDLERVEATLAKVQDDGVQLPLKLSAIQLDLTADGEPSEQFESLLKRILRSDLSFLEDNPEFLVQFDRGDVAWLRAYCHLLMAFSDVYLSIDTRHSFESMAHRQFPKVIVCEEAQVERLPSEMLIRFKVRQPQRLEGFRRHMIAVMDLNQETWKHIRAETDDDHEWLPNAKQTRGVLGLSVQDDLIDAWLAMTDECKALLEGDRAFFRIFFAKNGKGINLKAFLQDPPEIVELSIGEVQNLPDKYFTDARDIDLGAFLRVMSMLQNTSGVGYAAWFN